MRSALSLLVVALLALPFVPPTAEAQDTHTTGQLVLDANGVDIFQDDLTPTHFLHNGTARVVATIQNTGTTAMTNVPVYFWFTELPDVPGACVFAKGPDNTNVIPAATRTALSFRFGLATATWSPMTVPTLADRPAGDYNVTILVNRDPPSDLFATGKAFDRNRGGLSGCGGVQPPAQWGSCTAVTAPNCVHSCPAGETDPGTDCKVGNNLAFAYFVKDAQWDLAVASIRHCMADSPGPGLPTCDASMRDPASGAWLNATRRPNDWVCDDPNWRDLPANSSSGCTPDTPQRPRIANWGDSASGDSYFEVTIVNEANATWFDDLDRTYCSFSLPTNNGDFTVQTDGSPDILHPDAARQDGCEPMQYDLNITIQGYGLPAGGLALSPPEGEHGAGHIGGFANGRGVIRSTNWNISSMGGVYGPAAGLYSVTAKVDPHGRLPHVAETAAGGHTSNDQRTLDHVEIQETALRATLVGVTHTTIETAYEYTSQEIIVPVTARFFNDGSAAPFIFNDTQDRLAPQPATTKDMKVYRRPVNWSIWIDNVSPRNINFGQNTSVGNATTMLPDDLRPAEYRLPAFGPWTETVQFRFSATPGDTYIPPGKHTIYACVDCDPRHTNPAEWTGDNKTWERNESDNIVSADFYIKNTAFPVLEDYHGILTPYPVTGDNYGIHVHDPLRTTWHPRENMTIFANVSDQDQAHLNVSFEFTLAGTNVTRTYTTCGPGADPTGADPTPDCVFRNDATHVLYLAHIHSFARATNNTTESWELRTIANNSFGKVTRSQPAMLTLTRWPVQTIDASQISYGIFKGCPTETGQAFCTKTFYPDNSTFPYGSSDPLNHWVHLTDNLTGVTDQVNITRNLGMRVDFPENKTKWYNDTQFTVQFLCPNVGTGGNQIVRTPGADSSAPTCNLNEKGNFTSTNIASIEDRFGAGIPGHWNITLLFTDLGGEVREVKTGLTFLDAPPTLGQETFSSLDVKPGDDLKVHLNASDEFPTINSYVNFSRVTDHYNVSFELVNVTSRPNFDNTRSNFSYNDTIHTGRGAQFGVGGTYDAWFSAKDKFGNWNKTAPVRFVLNDTDRPTLVQAGVDQSLQEVGLDVTFHANATDATNITAYLQILRGSEAVVPRLAMNETSPGNFTYTANLTTEGNYVWNIWIVDSVNQQSDLRAGPLSVRDNLGPRFDVRQPSNSIDGQLYARAAPQLSFLVYDADGVDKDTLRMMVNGAVVTPDDVVPTASDVKGFIVNYTVPPTHRFSHRDVVTVNLSAIDLSNKTLAGFSNFTFVVDDVPPIVRLADFGPRFRAEDRNAWNVSLSTLFTLTADDNDGLPTTVDAIRYRIIGGGNNAAESAYSGPFRISDAPGIYTGPRIYQIQFWAIDSVGNQNRTFDSVTVYVDDIPPSLDPFGALPQGRFINATFIDDRSGVDRAVVWYSVNGGGYSPVALDFVGGVWSTVLPEGKKGDKVSYYLQAWDRVNNTDNFGNATNPYSTYAVGNHVPTIRITSPVEGSRIARVVDLTWSATDDDADPLTFVVYYRAQGKTNFVELAKIETPATRKYQLDTNRFQDGEYTFRVTAADGTFVALSDSKVTILNRGSAFGPVTPPPGQVQPGESIIIKAEITKIQATVEARVYRDGQLVNSYAMNDEGKDGDATANDGIYSVRVAFDQAGKYSVDILARYQEGGEIKEDPLPNAATFSVKLTPGGIFAEYQAAIVLVGLLAVAGVGVAAYVLLRRR